MPFNFNADDIFEIAEQIERNGAQFYRQAAQSVKEPGQQKLLKELAVMEVAHEKVFHEMRAGLEKQEKTATVFDANDESGAYLQALADLRVFYHKKMSTSSYEEILKSALEAEKDSIIFYLGMKDAVPEKSGKDKIDGIINEEKKHIQIISMELISLKKQDNK